MVHHHTVNMQITKSQKRKIFRISFILACLPGLDPSFTQGDEWPRGSYGFPKPKSGCPGGRNNVWFEGWRYQDLDDSDKSTSERSRISSGSHMDVKLAGSKKNVNRTFCMKHNAATQKRFWPKGSYCIYKSGTCPKDMESGWVFWDDEDGNNYNNHRGFLPDGVYDKETRIYYCCQTDGNWYDSIELPVSQPFYLLTSSSTDTPKCQMVKWAFSYLEYIVFDTEDKNNRDTQGGEHLFSDGDKKYYCYYEDCRRTMTGPSGSFRSRKAAVSELDPRSQYCSWLITLAETYNVTLGFVELTIPSCNDAFLRIYDGSNGAAPLLGTYCGSNASTEVVVLSSTNNLYIVSNSGSYARSAKNTFTFHAVYIVQNLAGNEWPSGSYGLPRSKSGCPGGKKFGWREGWRYQDMDDSGKSISSRSRVSSGSHMDVTLVGNRNDVNRKFCMKQNAGTQTRFWPKGSYCIYKSGTCPKDMRSGWVFWDDEDTNNNNNHGGFLPHGVYDEETKIYYCCQTDGNWYDSIELPVSQPFYLLTSFSTDTPKCQMVKWALSYLEYIVFDTENRRNRDNQQGEHLFLDGNKKYYCYYEECRRTMTGLSGSFRSHKAAVSEMDPRSQYCSWLITLAETYNVSLSFKELTIPSCNDTFLRIYNGSNGAAPLLGTYCGSNASTEVVVSLTTNSLYIVSNSGSCGRNRKNTFTFHAVYIVEILAVKEKTGSTVIIIATTAGGVVFLCIVLIVLLIKYKRRKRAPKLSTLIVNESLTDETPQESLQIALPLDQLPTKATVVNREFHGDVATKADQSEDVSGQETSGEYWIKELGLKNEDKTILKSQRMLNDRHMNAAQKLLKKKFPHISGLQDTILSQTSFVNTQGEGIQIHNTGKYHWITSSSIGGHVRVCDSRYDYLAGSTKVQLEQCYQNLINESGRLEVHDIRPVQRQTGSVGCGLFAIAFAYELAVGHQPVHLVRFDQKKMRSHLLSCFEKRELTHFPQARRQPATQPIYNKVTSATLCECKLPEKCNCAPGF